jgi:hypothetical protein
MVAARTANLDGKDPLICLDRYIVESCASPIESLSNVGGVHIGEVAAVNDHDRSKRARA